MCILRNMILFWFFFVQHNHWWCVHSGANESALSRHWNQDQDVQRSAPCLNSNSHTWTWYWREVVKNDTKYHTEYNISYPMSVSRTRNNVMLLRPICHDAEGQVAYGTRTRCIFHVPGARGMSDSNSVCLIFRLTMNFRVFLLATDFLQILSVNAFMS